jgi:hypothetical protein
VVGGVWVQRLRTAVQRSQMAAAQHLWGDMNELSFHIEAAASSWSDGHPDAEPGTGHLLLVQQQAIAMERTASMYEQVVKTAPAHVGSFARLFRLFALTADTINHSADLPDEAAAMKALQVDMRLVLALFPEDMLARGSATEFDQAMSTWCQQTQLKPVLLALTADWAHISPCR